MKDIKDETDASLLYMHLPLLIRVMTTEGMNFTAGNRYLFVLYGETDTIVSI